MIINSDRGRHSSSRNSNSGGGNSKIFEEVKSQYK